QFVAWFSLGSLVSDACGRAFVDERAASESVEAETLDQGMRTIMGDGVSHGVTARWNRLIAAGSPAAIDIEAFDRSQAHDRGGIGSDIDHAGPLAHEAQAAEAGKQLDDGIDRGVHRR